MITRSAPWIALLLAGCSALVDADPEQLYQDPPPKTAGPGSGGAPGGVTVPQPGTVSPPAAAPDAGSGGAVPPEPEPVPEQDAGPGGGLPPVVEPPAPAVAVYEPCATSDECEDGALCETSFEGQPLPPNVPPPPTYCAAPCTDAFDCPFHATAPNDVECSDLGRCELSCGAFSGCPPGFMCSQFVGGVCQYVGQ